MLPGLGRLVQVTSKTGGWRARRGAAIAGYMPAHIDGLMSLFVQDSKPASMEHGVMQRRKLRAALIGMLAVDASSYLPLVSQRNTQADERGAQGKVGAGTTLHRNSGSMLANQGVASPTLVAPGC